MSRRKGWPPLCVSCKDDWATRRATVECDACWSKRNPPPEPEPDPEPTPGPPRISRHHLQPCPECGELMTGGAGLCRPCFSAAAAGRRAKTIELYNAGVMPKDIAVQVGMTQSSVHTALARMRRDGVIASRRSR